MKQIKTIFWKVRVRLYVFIVKPIITAYGGITKEGASILVKLQEEDLQRD